MIETENTLPNMYQISAVFDWLPICAAIIDSDCKIVSLNRQALHFFGVSSHEIFFGKLQNTQLFADSKQMQEFIGDLKKGEELICNRVLLKRFDNSMVFVEMQARTIPTAQKNTLVLFKDESDAQQIEYSKLIKKIQDETTQLKPYLNKPGKELLEKILSKFKFIEKTNHPSPLPTSELICKKRLLQLSNIFPQFSENELVLSNFIAMNIPIYKISRLIGKTPNSIRVSIHRMLHKTNLNSKKDLITMLSAI